MLLQLLESFAEVKKRKKSVLSENNLELTLCYSIKIFQMDCNDQKCRMSAILEASAEFDLWIFLPSLLCFGLLHPHLIFIMSLLPMFSEILI